MAELISAGSIRILVVEDNPCDVNLLRIRPARPAGRSGNLQLNPREQASSDDEEHCREGAEDCQVRGRAEVRNTHQGSAEAVYTVGKRIDGGDHIQYDWQIR